MYCTLLDIIRSEKVKTIFCLYIHTQNFQTLCISLEQYSICIVTMYIIIDTNTLDLFDKIPRII